METLKLGKYSLISSTDEVDEIYLSYLTEEEAEDGGEWENSSAGYRLEARGPSHYNVSHCIAVGLTEEEALQKLEGYTCSSS